MGFKFLTVSPNKLFENYFNWYVRWRCLSTCRAWSNQKQLSSWNAGISPVVWEQQKKKACTHFMCKKCGTPFSYTRIASWLNPETHIYCDTCLFLWKKWADSGIFSKSTMRKKYLLPKFWFMRTYQTAKFWKFLAHVIIGNNVCAHVSSTDCRKKSQHKDSQ